jgi:hypothetical protein
MSDENQHWVPKFLIKQFADVDGRVYRLNIHTDEVTKPPPKYAAAKIAFNEFVIDGRRVSFEDELEKIETRAAPISKKIVRTQSLAGLDTRSKRRLADFAAAQSFRTEAFYRSLGISETRSQFGAVFAALWRSAFIVSDEIARRHWALMIIEGDDQFYLGDHPLVLQHTENPSGSQTLGFDIKGVEAFLPLSPTCALYMPCLTISRQILEGYEFAATIHRQSRLHAMRGVAAPGVTTEMLRASQSVLLSSHALYDGLTKGTPVSAAPENVENLNYLQCAWAHSAVYASRGGFEFARKVFLQTPQYRATPKVSLATYGSGEPFTV